MGSCTKETIETQESEIKTYTGEDLFRGIFLMEGEVAEKIPSYSRFLEEKNDYQSTQRKIETLVPNQFLKMT